MLGSAFGLGFQALPIVFASMGPTGAFVGFLWFFLLLLAAITSSMLQPIKAFAKEALGLSSGRAVALIGLVTGVGALWVFMHSGDQLAMDTMDFWVGTLGIFILAGTRIICFSWVMGAERGLEEASIGARLQIPRWFRIVLRWIAPAYLLIVFVGFCTQTLSASIASLFEHPVALRTIGWVALVFAALIVATKYGARWWKR